LHKGGNCALVIGLSQMLVAMGTA